MATADGDISEWADIKVITDAFRRGIKSTSGTGDMATISAIKKTIPDYAFKVIKDLEFTKACKDVPGKKTMPLKIFLSKKWFMTMGGGKEDKAKKIADDIVKAELATKAKEEEAKTKKGGSDVTSRLTDTSKYTGAHKERFDESGQGKGKSGRVDESKNTGYVGNYKGEGTFDKKH